MAAGESANRGERGAPPRHSLGSGRGAGGRFSGQSRSSSPSSSGPIKKHKERIPVKVFNPGPPSVDPRLGSKELKSLMERFRKLKVSKGRVLRRSFGQEGKKIMLRSNHFEIIYPKNAVYYSYDLVIQPEVKEDETRLRKRIVELFMQSDWMKPRLNRMATDRTKRLITLDLIQANTSVTVDYYEEGEKGPHLDGRKYTITFVKKHTLNTSELRSFVDGRIHDYDPAPIISALNLIMSTHASRNGIRLGKNRYFFPPSSFGSQERDLLSKGLEAWKGFFVSVRPTMNALRLNVNACKSAFYLPSASLSEVLRKNLFSDNRKHFITNLRVTTKYLGYPRKHKVKGLGPGTAKNTTFECADLGGKVTVEKYFKKKHDITLKCPNDELVIVGSKSKEIFIPAELCEIVSGQPYMGYLSRSETKKMIEYTRVSPEENAEMIVNRGLPILGLQDHVQPIKEFNIQVSRDMVVLPARVLDAPKVVYSNGNTGVVDGSWKLSNVKFLESAQGIKPMVVALANNSIEAGRRSDGGNRLQAFQNITEVRKTFEDFKKQCRVRGLKLGDLVGDPLLVDQSDSSNALKRIEDVADKGRPNLILVFLSNNDIYFYRQLKSLLDVKLGIASSCMQTVLALGGNIQYFSSVAMKVNAKLGGINHGIQMEKQHWLRGAMLVGIDVAHPSTGEQYPNNTTSIAAVVASCEDSFTQYPGSVRMQERRVEMVIDGLQDMMKERLLEYKRRNSNPPERVIVFRDGVSEGQFNSVLKYEVPKIKEALSEYKNLKLTVVICGKRHHTRFFPTRKEDADSSSNAKAGTVVDTGVTSVFDFDFYLQSHAALQGTARSAHYTVIYDENDLDADQIQKGIFDISHLWASATNSVSLAPPAYWADRLCARGTAWLHAYGEKTDQSERNKWGIHEKLKETMFYL